MAGLNLRRGVFGLALVVLITSGVSAQKPAPLPDEAAVRTVVETYLHGLKFNDIADLKRAFWTDAKLFFTKRDGTLGQLTQPEWYAGFAASAGKEEKGDLRITALEVTHDVASVKVVEDYGPTRYTDYLSLIRLQGRWQIVNKIYTVEKR